MARTPELLTRLETPWKGTADEDERHIWPDIRRIIEECEPSLVFCENGGGKSICASCANSGGPMKKTLPKELRNQAKLMTLDHGQDDARRLLRDAADELERLAMRLCSCGWSPHKCTDCSAYPRCLRVRSTT